VVQSHAALDKAFVTVFWGAGFEANRCAAANTVEELVSVADYCHPHQRQKLAVECASGGEIGNSEDHMRHAVDFDAHRASGKK
jgi:hypothetical protein